MKFSYAERRRYFTGCVGSYQQKKMKNIFAKIYLHPNCFLPEKSKKV